MGLIEITSCPLRSEEVPLEIEGSLVGVIGRTPVSPLPQTPEEWIKSAMEQNRPLYLDSFQHRVCAYPIGLQQTDALEPKIILAKNFQDAVLGFGVPTRLQSPASVTWNAGTIYDPTQDVFLNQDSGGMTWYLLGGSGQYSNFHRGILQYTAFLEQLWQENPLGIFFKESSTQEASPTHLPLTSEETARIVPPFLNWLKESDPELYQVVQDRLDFHSPSLPLSMAERLFCNNELAESAYAYYDPKSRKIHLLPTSLHWLKQGHYETVAQILAHESAHLTALESGLTRPSEELFDRSISLFLQNISGRGFLESWLVALFGETMGLVAHCNLLPLVPEEEAQAYAKEVAYAFSRHHGSVDADLVDEALSGTKALWENLENYFPLEWMSLSADYLALAGRQQPVWMQHSRRAQDIHRWFDQGAAGMKALNQLSAEHRKKITEPGTGLATPKYQRQ